MAFTPGATIADFKGAVKAEPGETVVRHDVTYLAPLTLRPALEEKGVNDAVVQSVRDNPDTALIKVPLEGEGQDGRARVREALNTFGQEAAATVDLNADPNAAYKIVGTDAVGAIAGAQLRNKAIAATLGPITRARLNWIELRAIAFDRSLGDTRVGISA